MGGRERTPRPRAERLTSSQRRLTSSDLQVVQVLDQLDLGVDDGVIQEGSIDDDILLGGGGLALVQDIDVDLWVWEAESAL